MKTDEAPHSLDWLKHAYAEYVKRYERYVRLRGFTTTINDWPYVKRSFITCWMEPGFHRFWQVWNPGISYFTWRLFLLLGGKRHWTMATLGTFLINGLVHTMIVAPFLGWGWSFIMTFLICGILTVLSRRLRSFLQQRKWPAILNMTVNVYLVILSFDLGFKLDRSLRTLL